MIRLGLLAGTVDDRVADQSYKRFFMHGTSHWLGMDVHDVGAYTRDGTARPLAPGMVITVEPGLYVAPDAVGVPDALRGIGVRIEDDVLDHRSRPRRAHLRVPEGDPGRRGRVPRLVGPAWD